MQFHRLIATFQRVTARDAQGNVLRFVRESINLVHPDDERGGRENQRFGSNAFREVSEMLRSNPNYINVEFTKVEAVVYP